MAVPIQRLGVRSWVEQGMAAVLWGVILILTPLDLVWIVPLALVGYEVFRAKRHGFFPGVLLDAGVLALMAAAAVATPVKYEDQKRMSLPDTTITLEALDRIHPFRGNTASTELVKLPSRTPTLREVARAVEGQTPYQCRIWRCGNGMTLLWGAYIMGVSLEHK